MSDASPAPRRFNWAEHFGFVHLFRAFRLAIHPTKLLLAFIGVWATYAAGRTLDAVWPADHQPLVVVLSEGAATGTSELEVFAAGVGGGRQATMNWLEHRGRGDYVQHVGAFKLLLEHARSTFTVGTDAVIHFDLRGLVEACRLALMGFAWLAAMHPLYAIIFLLIALVIWSVFGGAVCRVAALDATREERIGLREALAFAKGRAASFIAAPLMPLGVVVLMGAMLFVGGLLGAIPAIGDLVVGILFFLALIVGFAVAVVIVGSVAGFSLMFPTIAVEGSDAFDALSRSISYIYGRPWKTAFYAVVSLAYGALCLTFVKFFARLMLWVIHLFAGASMNWGSAYVTPAGEQASTHLPGKLTAMWPGPSLGGDTPFWGELGATNLAHVSWLGQLLIYFWVFVVVGVVAAFAVSFYYSASTLMYCLLRREVDATDLEDVYIEETPQAQPATTAGAAPTPDDKAGGSGGASLPVVNS